MTFKIKIGKSLSNLRKPQYLKTDSVGIFCRKLTFI